MKKKVTTILKSIFELYSSNLAILMPLLIASALVIVFVDKIPYLNLFRDTVVTGILTINWFVILWFSKLKTRTMLVVALVVFLLTFPLTILKLQPLVESMANLCYIILATVFIFEVMSHIRSSS